MNLNICSVEDCGDRSYSKGKCKKHYMKDYRRKKRYSLNKECDGVCIPKRVVMDKSRFCKSCIQKLLRGTLLKQIRTGSGATVFIRWDNKKKVWKAMGLNILEANRVMEDLIAQQGFIIRRDDAGNIVQIDKKVKIGRFVDVERVRWDD